jgi:hypothetical protein
VFVVQVVGYSDEGLVPRVPLGSRRVGFVATYQQDGSAAWIEREQDSYADTFAISAKFFQ